jgi:translation initiation factor IF-1
MLEAVRRKLVAGMSDRNGLTEDDPREENAGAVIGTVTELLPSGLYRVTIERQRQVTAHAPGGPGRNFIRVIVGDRVRLELSPRDHGRGRIVEKVS